MRLSEQALRNWIDTKLTIQDICHQLTHSGLEVEEVRVYIKNFQKVVIGQIVSCKSHPNIRTLMVSRVNIGSNYINIICKENNIKTNMKVFVACHGAKLFNGFIVQSLNIGGIISDGIFCTFNNLGIIDNKCDIISLPYSVPIGLCIQDYNFYQDKIIKINTTFNRIDTFGAFGIAREISILNNLPLPKIIPVKVPVLHFQTLNIHVAHHNMMYKCCGRIIKNINLATKTPTWMQEKLIKHQIYPINVVVDIINFVFIELGQSIYPFSFSSDIYDICLSYVNNDLLYKKYNNIVLNNNMIVLTRKNKILSFLGNIDFDLFPINMHNKNLFLGSFFVDLDIVNHSIHHVRLNNQIKLNEYFVDPKSQEHVIEYATYLFLKICGGYAHSIHNIQSKKYEYYIHRKIKLRYANVIKMIGCNINFNIIEKILIQLQCYIIVKCNFWYITPPSWRPDLIIEEDIISEIIKIYHYDNITPKPIINHGIFFKKNKLENFLKRTKYTLIDRGYYEVINYSFIDPKIQCLIHPNKKFLSIKNPISKDMSSMRLSLWPGLLKTLLYHQNRQHEEIRIFESGLCFIPNKNIKLGVDQNLYFSGVIGNIGNKQNWIIPARKFDFYDLKGDVESIFDSIGYLDRITFKKTLVNGLHSGNSTIILFNNIIIGIMGEIDPVLLKKFSLSYSTFLFELFWYKLNFYDDIKIHAISEFPSIKRDLSIIIHDYILVSDIIKILNDKFLFSVCTIQLSDIYQGPSIVSGYKSVTLRFVFQSQHKTLTDEYVDNIIHDCIKILHDQFHAVLRK